MSTKKIISIVVGIITVLGLIGIGWAIHCSQVILKNNELRHHVFCEQIKPGMRLSDVRKVLAQYGRFGEVPSTYNSEISSVRIYLEEPGMVSPFGEKSIYLDFENGYFIGASEPDPNRDMYRSICN